MPNNLVLVSDVQQHASAAGLLRRRACVLRCFHPVRLSATWDDSESPRPPPGDLPSQGSSWCCLLCLLHRQAGSFSGGRGKEPTYQGRRCDADLIPGLGRSPGGGNGNLLQYSCLENPMDRGAWWATVLGAAKSRTRLSD